MRSERGREPQAGDLLALLEQGRGTVDFLGASRGAPQLADAGRRLAGALASRGFTAGRRLVLLLPNTPTLLIALHATFMLDLRALVLDPRAELDALEDRLLTFRPELLLTSNPALLFDKVLRLLPVCPSGIPVVIERFTDLLPFPRNLLAPLLRGGGIATLPPDPRFIRYGDFVRGAQEQRREASARGSLEFMQETVNPGALQQQVTAAPGPVRSGERWLVGRSLAEPTVLARCLSGLHGGANLVLSPRLDRRSLDRIARQAGTDREIG